MAGVCRAQLTAFAMRARGFLHQLHVLLHACRIMLVGFGFCAGGGRALSPRDRALATEASPCHAWIVLRLTGGAAERYRCACRRARPSLEPLEDRSSTSGSTRSSALEKNPQPAAAYCGDGWEARPNAFLTWLRCICADKHRLFSERLFTVTSSQHIHSVPKWHSCFVCLTCGCCVHGSTKGGRFAAQNGWQ